MLFCHIQKKRSFPITHTLAIDTPLSVLPRLPQPLLHFFPVQLVLQVNLEISNARFRAGGI